MKVYRRFPFAFFLITAVSLFVRVFRIGSRDLWYDEIYTITLIANPWEYGRPPLYFALLRYWASFFGFSEVALRFPSLMCSVASVALTYFFVRRVLNNREAAFYSALFMALSSFQVWYAQEVRPYSLLLMWGLLSARAFYEIFVLSYGNRRWWCVFVFASVAGLYTSYFYLPLLTAQILYVIITVPVYRVRIPFLFFCGFCLLLPMYWSRLLETFHFIRGGFWVEQPGWGAPLTTLHNFMLGYNISPLLHQAFLLLLLFCIFPLFRALWARQHRKELSFLVYFFVFPFILIFAFSRFVMPVYLDRGLIWITPFCYAVISFGIASIRTKLWRYVCLGTICLMMSFGLAAFYVDWMPNSQWSGGIYIKRGVRPLVAYLREQFSADDAVAFTNPSLLPAFAYYGQDSGSSSFSFFSREKKDSEASLSTGERFFFSVRGKKHPLYYVYSPGSRDTSLNREVLPGEGNIPLYRIPSLSVSTIWVLSCTWERDGLLDENSRTVNAWMREHFLPAGSILMEGVHVFKYRRR